MTRMAQEQVTSAPRDRSATRLTRRAFLGAAALASAAGRVLAVPARAGRERGQPGAGITVFPRHDTRTASPYTEISFRSVTAEELGAVTVLGSISGGHSGLLMPHSDGNGVSYVPDSRFEPGEVVTVRAAPALGPAGGGPLTFEVARPAELTQAPVARVTNDPQVPPWTFRSRPDLLPPVMEITVPADGTAEGYVFLGASVTGGQNGAMILDNSGELVWFSPPTSELDRHYDVRGQTYRGEPVLTFSEANGPLGYRLGHYVICDTAYRRIVEFQIGNGYTGGDHHEFLLTPRGTALVACYHPVLWDLSPVGGSPNGAVMDYVIQEIDIEAGRVLFEWHCLDHIALEESYSALPPPGGKYDYVHANSIDEDANGDLLISARHTFAMYKIDRATGEIAWRLNGKRSDFEMAPGTPFAYTHDARFLPNGQVSVFDNAAGRQEEDATTDSRGLVLDLDMSSMTATLAREYIHPTGILSISQANMQTLPNGNVFIGWGSAPVFSEFTADGALIFNGRFPSGGSSYRAYRFPWAGTPADPPDVAVEAGSAGAVTVYASWNGATEVATWRVLAGPAPTELYEVESAPRAGFETAIEVQPDAPYLAVEALDVGGAIIGASEAIQVDR